MPENLSEEEFAKKLSEIKDPEKQKEESQKWIKQEVWTCKKCGLTRDNVHTHKHGQELPREVLERIRGSNAR